MRLLNRYPESASSMTSPTPYPRNGHFLRPRALVTLKQRRQPGFSPREHAASSPKRHLSRHDGRCKTSAPLGGCRCGHCGRFEAATPWTTGHTAARTPQTPGNGGQSSEPSAVRARPAWRSHRSIPASLFSGAGASPYGVPAHPPTARPTAPSGAARCKPAQPGTGPNRWWRTSPRAGVPGPGRS